MASPVVSFRVKVQGPLPNQVAYTDVTVDVQNVNDEAPIINFPSSPVEVAENTGIGDTVQTLTATDPDAGSTNQFE